MSVASNNNFNVKHEYRDFFADVQRNWKRIGDVGEESDEFLERAYKQFHEHDFAKLAEIQDEFIATDPTAGTPGRENNRNYNRMEYDTPVRDDGKEHAEVMTDVEANAKVAVTVDEILDVFKTQGWTLNNTASAIGSEPIQKSDYDEQMTTDK